MPDATTTRQSALARWLAPIAEIRPGEGGTALLMFLYSFLAMTSYNIVKPVTRSQFITSLGADNLPWVQFAAGMVIGVLMQAYTKAIATVPRRWTIPVTQAGMIVLLVTFWVLFTQVGAEWVSVGFYLYGLILGILLISQFWTLANDIYEPRQAKRLFGLIGGGASLGGATGAAITATLVERARHHDDAAGQRRDPRGLPGDRRADRAQRTSAPGQSDAAKTGEEEGVGGGEALALLRGSRHLQIIALVITFAAIGAAIIEQQLNMAAAEAKGQANTDSITAVPRPGHRLPVAHRPVHPGRPHQPHPPSARHRLRADDPAGQPRRHRPADARRRRAVDLGCRPRHRHLAALHRRQDDARDPVPAAARRRQVPRQAVHRRHRRSAVEGRRGAADPGADQGLGPGAHLAAAELRQSLAIMVLWVFFALRARAEYMAAFRRSIVQQDMKAGEIRLETADLSTIEALVEELAHPEPKRVVYALDLLESLDKRHLVSPLMLYHEHPDVRVRVLRLAEATGPSGADRWLRGIERSLTDHEGDVRSAAVRALASVKGEEAAALMRPYLDDADAGAGRHRRLGAVQQQRGRRPRTRERTRSASSSTTRASSARTPAPKSPARSAASPIRRSGRCSCR